MHGCHKIKPLYVHALSSNSWTEIFCFSGVYFSSSTIRVLIFTGWMIKSPHLWFRSSVYLFLWSNITHIFHIHLCQTPNPNHFEYCFILQITLYYFHGVSSILTQVDQFCCTFHLFTLAYCCVGLDHSIIVFTSGFT